MNGASPSVYCAECGTDLAPDAADGQGCPHCGSFEQQVRVLMEDSFSFKDEMLVKVEGKPRQSGPSMELRVEQSWSRKRAKWLERRIRIDRANDQYMEEEVVDPDTGEVVHHTFERLSIHIGHGSAREIGKKQDSADS